MVVGIFRTVRIKRPGGTIGGLGARQVAGGDQRATPGIVECRAIRRLPQRFVDQGKGRGGITPVACEHPQKVQRVGLIRIAPQDTPIRVLGLGKPPGLMILNRLVEFCRWVRQAAGTIEIHRRFRFGAAGLAGMC
jgi:hypothetical protein